MARRTADLRLRAHDPRRDPHRRGRAVPAHPSVADRRIRLLDTTPEALTTELIDTMLRNGAITLRDKRLHASAEHTTVTAESLQVQFPRAWPPATPNTTQGAKPK